MLIRIIVNGKWRSPNHSDDHDDTHDFKKKLLKEIAKKLKNKKLKPYYGIVGKNPDLGVDKKTKKIKLKGAKRGPFSGKELPTDIDADEFFVLLILNPETPDIPEKIPVDEVTFGHYYVIPPSNTVASELLDYLEENNITENVLLQIAI